MGWSHDGKGSCIFTVALPDGVNFEFNQYANSNWRVTAVYGENRQEAIQSLPDAEVEPLVRVLVGEELSPKTARAFTNKLKKKYGKKTNRSAG